MGRKSERRRGFGLLLGNIRNSTDDSQPTFAARLNVSRSLIASVETGTPPSNMFLALLAAEFPERETEIYATAERYRPPRIQKRGRRAPTPLQHKVSSQITANELQEARDTLRHWMSAPKPDEHSLWAVEHLSQVERLLGNFKASRVMLRCAIELARLERGNDSKAVALWEQYVLFYCNDRDMTLDILGTALREHPTAAALWYRKGVAHWEASELGNAYAALTTALAYRGSRIDILPIRAQILLDWERPDDALADLDEMLVNPAELTPLQTAFAQCIRSYANFRCQMPAYGPNSLDTNSRPDREVCAAAIRELEEIAEAMPDNPWPRYFGAMCMRAFYEDLQVHTDVDLMLGVEPPRPRLEAAQGARLHAKQDLEAALKCQTPPLSQGRIEHIEAILRSLNQQSLPTM
jgi:transcriptional regulator with XRE-family HTH domain